MRRAHERAMLFFNRVPLTYLRVFFLFFFFSIFIFYPLFGLAPFENMCRPAAADNRHRVTMGSLSLHHHHHTDNIMFFFFIIILSSRRPCVPTSDTIRLRGYLTERACTRIKTRVRVIKHRVVLMTPPISARVAATRLIL